MKRSIIISSVLGSSLVVVLITLTLSILGSKFIVDRIEATTKITARATRSYRVEWPL